jgi:OmcA/MtrC family decaheme c-type cytochrome
MAVDDVHELTGGDDASVSDVAIAAAGADLQVTFKVSVDGSDPGDFDSIYVSSRSGTIYAFRLVEVPASDPVEYTQENYDTLDPATALTGPVAGVYTITVPGAATDLDTPSRYYFRVSNPDGVRLGVGVDTTTPPRPLLVADQACRNCHGSSGQGMHNSDPMSAQVCTVCHLAENSAGGEPKAKFFNLIHSVHNSHNMPGGKWEFDASHVYKVTYPTYMNNCNVCHSEAGMLAAANGMIVTKANCFSCHASTKGFGDALDDLAFHHAYDDVSYPSDVCQDCHVAGGAALKYVKVTDFHNGKTTERGGVIWNGVDTSVTEGAKFGWQITGVVDNGTTLAISWTATYGGSAVNPCNATVAANAPAFHAIPALPPVPPATSPTNRNNLSVLYTYAQGEDPILGTANNPGQADNVGVSTSNTTCAANVATTTITPKRVAGATRARIALQGKPWVLAVDPADADGVMQVRAKTPTYDFVVGTGAKATDRRVVVNTTEKCVKCHVGSLYQHGGNRVDNIDMCMLCHNSASSDQSVRDGMGVTAAEAYDGKVGQTFEMKTMLHRIHSGGAANSPPFVIYRNRGIYAWAPEGTVIPNWPTGTPDADGKLPVYGAVGDNALQVHNYHNPTYPRLLNDCMACHDSNWKSLVPDQAKAMAATLDAGKDPWTNQVDDVLQGAGAAACTSCHKSAAALGHAYQNGWEPSTFEKGRQTIIDAAPK